MYDSLMFAGPKTLFLSRANTAWAHIRKYSCGFVNASPGMRIYRRNYWCRAARHTTKQWSTNNTNQFCSGPQGTTFTLEVHRSVIFYISYYRKEIINMNTLFWFLLWWYWCSCGFHILLESSYRGTSNRHSLGLLWIGRPTQKYFKCIT